ncbi:MAG: hypothetical protein F6K47_41975 [Symploca sp. SIO2E6]|nr:hypothetical protein [Symploca sp. SIO2E6]
MHVFIIDTAENLLLITLEKHRGRRQEAPRQEAREEEGGSKEVPRR